MGHKNEKGLTLYFFKFLTQVIGVIIFYSALFCEESHVFASVAYLSIAMTTFILVLEISIVVLSSRGTITKSHPRRHVSTLLHIRLAVFMLEVIVLIVKTILAAQSDELSDLSKCPNLETAIIIARVVVAVTWFLFSTVCLAVVIYLDPCRCYSAKVNFEMIEDVDGEMDDRRFRVVHRRWQLTHSVWEKRFRVACCFAGSDEKHQIAYKEVAEIFAYLFCDSSLVLSDIAAGLVLVQQEHLEREHAMLNSENPLHPEYSVSLNFNDPLERKLFQDAVHFLRFALGSYSWPIYMYMNPCFGCCKLYSHVSLCPCKKIARNNVSGDNSCYCGFAGAVSITELNSADIVYASFENDLYRAPFMVVLDHEEESVVIAVRGTLSFQDIITDLTASTHQIELPNSPTFHVHKGMYHTAVWVKEKLDDGILEEAFTKVPQYRLVVVGHSLGSGCACLLALLLREQYPDLQCFCYSPSGSLMNADAAAFTQSFVTSVTLGQDLVARLNVPTAHKLKDDVIRVLKSCRKPKHRILLEGALETIGKCCGRPVLFKEHRSNSCNVNSETEQSDSDMSPLIIPNSNPLAFDSLVEEVDNDREFPPNNAPQQLYPPGRIIHLVDTMEEGRCFFAHRRLEARWVSSSSFQRIVVSPDMVRDHFPDVLMRAMNAVWQYKKDELVEVEVDSLVNS